MGGDGSGRRGGLELGKEITSDYIQLGVRYLRRKGYLAPGASVNLRWNLEDGGVASINARCEAGKLLTLSRTHLGNAADSEIEMYAIQIVWTHCNYGGARPWFLCPARGCGRRVAILYGVAHDGTIFACRHCYDLTYESRIGSAQDRAFHRAIHRAEAIRMKLGGAATILGSFPWKPKGMHQRTYDRLRLKGQQAEAQCWENLRGESDRFDQDYERLMKKVHRRS